LDYAPLVTERRRLPVIQSAPPAKVEGVTPSDEEAPEARPPWHWVGFGTVAIFAAWLPLAYAAQAVVARLLAHRFGADASAQDIALSVGALAAGERARLMALLALPNVLALGLASFGGGYLVGRFGEGTGLREAASAGAMTALVALVLALGGGAASGGLPSIVTGVVTVLLSVGFAAWGGRVGLRKRQKPAR
jgi:tRNA-(ms[2]io[6]A)-hydroxylase